jgi:hypothetical protein
MGSAYLDRPDIRAALDPKSVAPGFEELLRRRDHGVVVESCERRDTKYDPGKRCLVAYRLACTSPARAPYETFGSVEATASHLRHRVLEDDECLPGLARALDADEMTKRCASAAPETVTRAGPSLRVVPISYKPERACVLGYDGGPERAPARLFGKLFARPRPDLFDTMLRLDERRRKVPGMIGVPRPLAYWQDMDLLLTAGPEGAEDLHALLFGHPRRRGSPPPSLRSAGEALALFHSEAGAPGPQRSRGDDFGSLHRYRRFFEHLVPFLTDSFDRAVGALEELAGRQEEDERVASHGALRTDQLLVGPGGLFAVDLDGYCWASPERDLANLIAYLRWRAIRHPPEAALIERSIHAFLDGYRNRRAVSGQRLAFYTAVTGCRIAGRRLRSLSFDEWPLLGRLLDEGFAWGGSSG